MWKCTVLLLLAFPPSVNSKETPTPTTLHTSSPTSSTASLGMCAVCLEKDCATGVRRIYPAGSDIAVWVKENSRTGIQNCPRENLKADAPCKMAKGSLVQLADNPLIFEGIDTYDLRRVFNSQILPCADLNLPPKPSLGVPHLDPVTKAPIHNTPTPAATNNSVADNKGIIIGSVIGIIIFISIGVLIWMCNSRGQGQDGDHRHGNNGMPHDAEDRDEIKKQPPMLQCWRT